MQVVIGGSRVALAARNALGDGGEATVTRHQTWAVKVYHQPTPARAAKLRALIDVAPALPDGVIGPQQLVLDARGKDVVGFAMRALTPGHEPLAMLSRRRARQLRGIGARAVADLFLRAHDTLAAVHRAGAVVGDLNDMNEMFAGDAALRLSWIDVDSWQYGGFACEVATEAFLDPRLYGPDLARPVVTADALPRAFDVASDWYAFAVLLFRSLTLVHPYGGVDPDLPTLPRRAAARRSVFSPGVRYPSAVGYALDVLSDPLAELMRAAFERGERGVFPKRALAEYASTLRRCDACHADYPNDRPRCPICAALAPPVTVTSRTGCTARDLIEARGPVVALCASPTMLRCVALEDGALVLYAFNGRGPRRTSLCAAAAAEVVELADDVLAVAGRRDPAPLLVHALRGDSIGSAVTLTTERFAGGVPSSACAAGEAFRVARGVVLRGHFVGDHWEEQPIATAMPDQTRLFAGRTCAGAALLAVWRVFGERQAFVFAGGARTELSLPGLAPGEAIVDEAALFSSSAVAYLRRTRLSGKGRVHTLVVSLDGELRAAYVEDEERRAAGGAVHGGAFAGSSLLFATDRGLAREGFGAPADAHPESKRLLSATEPFVAHAAQLAPFADGMAVAHGARVRLLSLD